MKRSKVFLFFCCLSLFLSCQSEPYTQGKNLYIFYCANCHMEDGSGLAKLIPALTDAHFLSDNRELLPCIIKYGMEGPIVINGIEYNEKMEGFIQLTDAEISNLSNYVLNKWASNKTPMLPESVSKALEDCPKSLK